MSNSVSELKPIKVRDPRVNIKEASKYLFKQGANVVTHRTFNATSSSVTSTTFKCNPPNPNIVISRLVYVKMKFRGRYTLVNTADGATIAGGSAVLSGTADINYICPRQFPLASVTRSLKLNLNSDTLTVEPYKYIHALGRFNLEEDNRAYEMSSSPSQPDAFQKFNDRSAHNGAAPFVNNIGGVYSQVVPNDVGAYNEGVGLGNTRSPFNAYGELGYEIPRGAYQFTNVRDNAVNNEVTFDLDVIEPVFISPFSGGSYNLMGLSQITTMDFDFNWDSKLERILSIDEVGIALSQGNVNGAGELSTRVANLEA